MSGGRNTGTVPKTKHTTRARRENSVNHIPNNLEWHQEDRQRRVRKESNNYVFHLPDTGDEFSYDSSWSTSWGPSNRTDDDELRWSSVKSSNITPERGGMEQHQASNRVKQRQENHVDERIVPENIKSHMARGRLKMKIDQSEKKIEELQHQQAALLTLRHKAIQQVKPVQMEEIHQSPIALRSKAIQQVKPVQMESEKIAKLNERMDDHMIQLLKAMENGIEPPSDQHVKKKLNELLAKKAQCDKILCCLESSDVVQDGPASPSSEECENGRNDYHENDVSLGAVGGDVEDHHQNIEAGLQWDGSTSRREAEKQDNREIDNMAAISALIENKDMKLDEVMTKFEQLQTLMGHMEKLRDLKLNQRGLHTESLVDTQPAEPLQVQQAQSKNCSQHSAVEKLHSKKVDVGLDTRQLNSYPPSTQSMDVPGYHNMFDPGLDSWPASSWNGPGPTGNSIESSSDEGEVEYDESPVKLCSSTLRPPSNFPKFRRTTQPNAPNSLPPSFKPAPSPVHSQHQNGPDSRIRQRVQHSDENHSCSNSSSLAYQVNQLQVQMEQIFSLCQTMMEKQAPCFNGGSQQWIPPPQIPHPGYLHYLNNPATSQWQQHQILVNSLNQCCQLIWHQQKELSALRQALAMLQDESNMYKCGGYGNNLNFESGLFWPQSTPQTLNNQVPPGNRANNYWDNFRSYSRQNLLSGRNKSNEGSIADSSTLLAPTGLPLPVQPSTTQAESTTSNLQTNRKDNCVSDNSSHDNCSQRRQQEVPSPVNNWNFSRRTQRRGHNLDSSSIFSLEQSIYNELEIVMAERNRPALLQLLSHLKILRSSKTCPLEGAHTQRHNSCDIDQNLPNFVNSSQHSLIANSHPHSHPQPGVAQPQLQPQPQPQLQPQPLLVQSLHNSEEKLTQNCQQDDSTSKLLAEVSKIIESKENDICTSEFLQHLVIFLSERLNPQIIPKLEASLLKFHGTSLDQVGHVLLCDIASIVWSHLSNPPAQQDVNMQLSLPDQEVEEGAVGGILLPPPQHQQSPQENVDTELAEADQPQHNSSNNTEDFWIKDESDLPSVETDNQELPPREDNESLQDTWSAGQGL